MGKKSRMGYSSVIDVNGYAYTQGYEKISIRSIALILLRKTLDHKYSSELGDKYFQGVDQPLQFTEECFICKGMGENCLP